MKSSKKSLRILIANRGEIAIRVAKAIRELGHIAIGLWTESEPTAAHLAFCQEWIFLSGENNSETYLNQEKIFSIIESHQIDAVHPGYGFLAENAGFARRVVDQDVIWIGPHPLAIEQMGDKAVSKKIASEAGVPIIPGSVGEVKDLQEAKSWTQEIGFPVLLKATAGGGGKGMRICRSASEIESQFEAVKREALSSFGQDSLLVEKFIEKPHHIEVQIVADKHGNCFHAYERECSIQRRHQKLLEEAPSPFIGDDSALRNEICETAVRLAKKVKYDSVGTVEFIMGADKQFFFLEMNTRIQVEHPITEEVTGLDLVVLQINSALGEELPFADQKEITLSGHAIECRICAENPVSLLPSPGTVTGLSYDLPQGVRFDHCLFLDAQIKSDFDPMVGKLIARGHLRKNAIDKLQYALKNLFIGGLCHNASFHKALLSHPVFLSGDYSTDFIEVERPQNILENDGVRDQVINDALSDKVFSWMIEKSQ